LPTLKYQNVYVTETWEISAGVVSVSAFMILNKAVLYLIVNTQVWKQTSGDPSGQTWNYCGITLLYNFMTALLYMVSSVTMARIVAMLLDIY